MAENNDPRNPQPVVSTTFPGGSQPPAPVQPAPARNQWGLTDAEERMLIQRHYPYHDEGEARSLLHEEIRISGMLERVRREGW